MDSRGNIGGPGWRPRQSAFVIGLPLLVASVSAAPRLPGLLHAVAVPLPVARALTWALCLTSVFGYVAKTTTGRRGNMLRGRHGGYRDFLAVQLAGLGLFFVAIEPSGVLSHGSPTEHLLALTIPLVAGAHFSYAEKLPPSIVLSISAINWRRCNPAERGGIAIRLVAVGLAITLASGFSMSCVVAAAVLATAYAYASWAVRPSGFVPYLHHWFVFLCLAALAAASVPVAMAAAGGFAEGAARWSCAPLWHRVERMREPT